MSSKPKPRRKGQKVRQNKIRRPAPFRPRQPNLYLPTEDRPLGVCVIHGDPTKPNRILPGGKWDEDDWETIFILKEALSTLKCYRFIYLCNHDTIIEDLQRLYAEGKFEIVLQLCDEGWQNDPRMELHVTAMLEMLRIPYTGTGTHSLAISYDKDFVLLIARSVGVPLPRSLMFEDGQEIKHDLEYPVFVKPNNTDGSFGITEKSVCHNEEELHAAVKMIRETFNVRGCILVQEYLPGKDVTYGMIGNPPHDNLELPITEEDYSLVPENLPRILGFESKWITSSPYWNIRSVLTTIPEEQRQTIIRYSKAAFNRIGYRDYCRFDWRLDAKGNPRLLEINPNCGWCSDGHLAKIANIAGYSYPQMLDMILRAAINRYIRAANEKVPEPADINTLMQTVAQQIRALDEKSEQN